jgi:hypothetical protein
MKVTQTKSKTGKDLMKVEWDSLSLDAFAEKKSELLAQGYKYVNCVDVPMSITKHAYFAK